LPRSTKCVNILALISSSIIQKLNTATGARRQPIIFEITTAGHDRLSVCRQHPEFSIKALEGSVPPEAGDSWFAYIATLDPGDDWTDSSVWIKANPSLGVTVKTMIRAFPRCGNRVVRR
jgi:phage terminase large subunit-like protein